MLFIDWDYSWAFLLAGFIYFFNMFSKYCNQGANNTSINGEKFGAQMSNQLIEQNPAVNLINNNINKGGK